MIKIIAGSFILGLSFGWGPCLASCGPLILAYVAGTGKNVLQGIGTYVLFSLSRIAVYLVLGLLFFFLGRLIFAKLAFFYRPILGVAGVFVILLGALMLLDRNLDLAPCKFLHKNILEQDRKSIIILGLAIGILPCAPLVTILTYAGLTAKNAFENLFYIVSFGLGTSLSPLLILTGLTGLLPGFLKNVKRNYARLFNVICGLIIIITGWQLIRRAF
ncbi:MAG: sulfite exporter TauE/SafE family protein [Candidatus Omnitrophica bacterium]|nr:sulfite exporter TauE/SafE family protein [Candidatus Omnitrophota bacterium]